MNPVEWLGGSTRPHILGNPEDPSQVSTVGAEKAVMVRETEIPLLNIHAEHPLELEFSDATSCPFLVT